MLAVVKSLKYFQIYVLGRRLLVRTDHNALQWPRNFKEPVRQMARWLERLAEYDFVISTLSWKESRHLLRPFAYTEYFRNCNPKQEMDNAIFQDIVYQLAKARRSYFAVNRVTQQDRAPRRGRDEGTSRILRYYYAQFNKL